MKYNKLYNGLTQYIIWYLVIIGGLFLILKFFFLEYILFVSLMILIVGSLYFMFLKYLILKDNHEKMFRFYVTTCIMILSIIYFIIGIYFIQLIQSITYVNHISASFGVIVSLFFLIYYVIDMRVYSNNDSKFKFFYNQKVRDFIVILIILGMVAFEIIFQLKIKPNEDSTNQILFTLFGCIFPILYIYWYDYGPMNG